MKHSHPDHAHSHSHSHAADCSCDHSHDHHPMSLGLRWALSLLIVGGLLVLLRPFIVGQMLVRVTSYSASASYSDAARICRKILAVDHKNIQAWTALGYAYRDLSREDEAIAVFKKVLWLNPANKGAASFELGRAYYAKGDYVQAIVSFERVRSAGPRAGALLDADILKYRHGKLGFRSVNSMQTLLGLLLACYQKTGDTVNAAVLQKEYDLYKNKHSKVLF